MSSKTKLVIKIIVCSIILIVLIFLYSRYINSMGFKVKEYSIYNNELPKEYDGFKIAHISDIHYGVSILKKELSNIVDKINLTKPDIVVLTGDLLDDSVSYTKSDIDDIIKELNKIECSIEKYAIAGNNDYSNQYWQNIIDSTNFINLNDSYELIYKSKTPLLISGLSTKYNNNNVNDKIKKTNDYLKDNDLYSILIIHEPDEIKNIDYSKFNLILAGHSHGGQIRLPLIGGLIVKDGSKKYINEYYKLDNTDLYISNGLSNSNIKYRFLNKPSFTLYRLRNK